MKKIITTLLFVLPFLAQAQTIEYSIYAPSKDSFFLVETVTGVASKDAPKPGKSEVSQLFRSEAQLLDYIKYLGVQAEKARNEAAAAIEKAKQLNEAAPRIEDAAAKIEAVAKANKDVLQGRQPEPKPPVKKKKKA